MWRPSAPQVGPLARGESIVEWSGKHGWRVVPLSEIPTDADSGAGIVSGPIVPAGKPDKPADSGALAPQEILRRYPVAARKAGIR